MEASATPDRHICGRCNDEFLTEQEYLEHTCQATGTTPTDPAHLGPEFAQVQAAALQRGADAAAEAGDHEQVAKNEAAIADVTASAAPATEPAAPAPDQPAIQ